MFSIDSDLIVPAFFFALAVFAILACTIWANSEPRE